MLRQSILTIMLRNKQIFQVCHFKQGKWHTALLLLHQRLYFHSLSTPLNFGCLVWTLLRLNYPSLYLFMIVPFVVMSVKFDNHVEKRANFSGLLFQTRQMTNCVTPPPSTLMSLFTFQTSRCLSTTDCDFQPLPHRHVKNSDFYLKWLLSTNFIFIWCDFSFLTVLTRNPGFAGIF